MNTVKRSNQNTCKKILSTSYLAALLVISNSAFSADNNGIIKLKSNNSVKTTINKLEQILNKKGMSIFKRIDHSAGADKVGIPLAPTELLIFGNPKVGTPLMLCSQTVALDLPQKALAYKDKNGQVWLSYNDPMYLAQRHQIKGCHPQLKKISQALAAFSKAATE